MQVTPVSSYSGAQDLWDWTTNVADGVGIFNGKLPIPDTYPATIKQAGVFQNAYVQLNTVRKANGLKPVTPNVPLFSRGAPGGDWSGGWNDTTIHQYERDVIQGYNGYCDSTSQYGTLWHQYQLLTTDGNQESPPQITVNETTLVGSVQWTWIPTRNRPNHCGNKQYAVDPAYVDEVLAQDPTCGTGANSCQ